MHDAQFGTMVSVAIAIFVSLIGHATVCAEQHECLKHGTCYSLNSGSALDPSCSFRTTVTPAGHQLLNASMQDEALQLMNRGICAPGLRQQIDTMTGELTCVRKRSWPDAFLEEIGDPSGSTDHDRYCGKWIAAGSIAYGSKKWAFYDADEVERDVDNIVRAKGASRMATTDLGKFRSSCRTMVAANTQGAAAKQAYGLLLPGLRSDSLGLALESVGFLASHYCDAPALVGVGTEDDRFVAAVREGTSLSDSSLKNALYVVGEPRSLRDDAREFADVMRQLDYEQLPPITQEQVMAVVTGTHAGTWIDGHVGSNFLVASASHNEPLERFCGAFASHGASQGPRVPQGRGRRVLARGAGDGRRRRRATSSRSFGADPGGPAASRTAAALGRLVAPARGPRRRQRAHAAQRVDRAPLRALGALVGAARKSAREVCLAAAKRVFPDDFDRIAFNALVTPSAVRAASSAVEQLARGRGQSRWPRT